LAHLKENGAVFPAFFRQGILYAYRDRWEHPAPQNLMPFQMPQGVGQRFDGDVAQIAAKLIEALGLIIELRDNGERPFVADHLQGFVDSGEAGLIVTCVPPPSRVLAYER